jgi:UrcA family protein
MRLAHPLVLKLSLAAAGGAALLSVLPSIHVAAAATTAATAPYGEQVTVLAPQVSRVRVGTGRHNQPVEVASLAMNVSYADLDLTKPSDQQEFKDRITNTAREACQELDRQTTLQILQPPVSTDCIGDASMEALKVADQVIAAANQASG